MSDDIRHFLVTRRFGKLDSIIAFDDADAAVNAYRRWERGDADCECVLLGADRLATCIATHGNWFDEPNLLDDERLRDALAAGDIGAIRSHNAARRDKGIS